MSEITENKMDIVNVDTEGGAYPINIGKNRLQNIHKSIPSDASSIAIITNQTINDIYGQQVLKSIKSTGKPVIQIVLQDGEQHKNWETLNQIYDSLLSNHLDRKAVLVALGGGVVGDMVGFAAATYMRGIRFIQVPTTLLAQVDSSVGGKTAINHPLGKNMIGAFYQPIAVEIDTTVLKTLPENQIAAGLAEIIKYGAIIDEDFFVWCEQNVVALKGLDEAAINYAIKRSCELKAYVVGCDERESGLRAILNFGHTFGHAIEAGLGYGKWLHGEAVGCGMIQAAQLSQLALGLPKQDVTRIAKLVAAIDCPVVAPDLGQQRWLDLMSVDKKALAGEIRFVLIDKIGSAKVQTVDLSLVKQVLDGAGNTPYGL